MDIATKKSESRSHQTTANSVDSHWKSWPIARNEYRDIALKAYRIDDHDKAVLYDSKALSCGFVNKTNLHQEIRPVIASRKREKTQKCDNVLIDYLSDCMNDMDIIEIEQNELTAEADDQTQFIELREKCAKLPKEWNVIQLSQLFSGYNGYCTKKDLYTMDAPIKITMFRHNLSEEMNNQPFSMVLDLIEYGAKSIFTTAYEIHHVLYKNYIAAMNSSGFDALKQKLSQAQKKLVTDMKLWLGPWLILFTGKIKGKSGQQFEKKIYEEVKQFTDKLEEFTDDQFVMLNLMARRIDLLDNDKVKQAAVDISRNRNQYLSIREFLSGLKSNLKFNEHFEYYPCILVIDEILDPMPWEMILPSQEYSRIHSIYSLFDLYEKFNDQIDDGYLKLDIKNGFSLLNPCNDNKLDDMCARMNKYYDDYLPHWARLEKTEPTLDQMSKGLCESDLFVYSGHGSSLQLLSSWDFQQLKHSCIMMLFGCASIAMKPRGSICEAICSSYIYFACGCPGMLGTITIVTDTWMDLITISLLTQWIAPKQAKNPRIDVCRYETSLEHTNKILAKYDGKRNPNLLALLCDMRSDADISLGIRSAMVYRGLPPYNKSHEK